MRTLVASVLVVAVSFGRADGQSGTITYASGVSLDVELPRDMAEVRNVLEEMGRMTFLLHFTPSQSLMVRGVGIGDGVGSPAEFRATNASLGAFARALEAWFAAEPIVFAKAYVGAGVSGVKLLSSMDGEVHRVAAADTPVEWSITEQHAEHLGYHVTRAVGEVGGESVEAWFAPDIPISAGPSLYGGLPGMILVLSLKQGRIAYTATEVALEGVEDGLIQVPDEVEAISPEEFRSFITNQITDMISPFRDLVRWYQDVDCIVGRRDSFVQCRRSWGDSSR